MSALPTRFVSIIVAFSGLFRQRTWRHAEQLLIGAMLAPGVRTVASVLRVLGLADERHFVNYHRVLSRAVWSFGDSRPDVSNVYLVVVRVFKLGTESYVGGARQPRFERGAPPGSRRGRRGPAHLTPVHPNTIRSSRLLRGNLKPTLPRSPAAIQSASEHPCRPPVVIFLAGDKPTTAPQFRFDGSVVALRVRALDDLLSIAQKVPDGLVLLRAESFCNLEDLHSWRSAHPSDWVTALLLLANAISVRTTLTWLTQWPLPVLLDGPASGSIDRDAARLVGYAPDVRESCRLVSHFASHLMSVKPTVAAHLIATYASPDGPSSLKQLAGGCHKSERHVRRVMRAIGIRSSYLYFAASRVLRAYRDVMSDELPLAELARRHGFGTPRTLHSEWLHVTGAPLRRARGSPLTDAVLELVARRVVEPLQ